MSPHPATEPQWGGSANGPDRRPGGGGRRGSAVSSWWARRARSVSGWPDHLRGVPRAQRERSEQDRLLGPPGAL